MKNQIGAANPTPEPLTLAAIDVATGAEAVMSQAAAWAATLAICAFILFVIYGGASVLP
jgi:hypothetical protein